MFSIFPEFIIYLLFLFGYILCRLVIKPVVYIVFLYTGSRITEPIIFPT
jgi:hypothetical protein